MAFQLDKRSGGAATATPDCVCVGVSKMYYCQGSLIMRKLRFYFQKPTRIASI